MGCTTTKQCAAINKLSWSRLKAGSFASASVENAAAKLISRFTCSIQALSLFPSTSSCRNSWLSRAQSAASSACKEKGKRCIFWLYKPLHRVRKAEKSLNVKLVGLVALTMLQWSDHTFLVLYISTSADSVQPDWGLSGHHTAQCDCCGQVWLSEGLDAKVHLCTVDGLRLIVSRQFVLGQGPCQTKRKARQALQDAYDTFKTMGTTYYAGLINDYIQPSVPIQPYENRCPKKELPAAAPPSKVSDPRITIDRDCEAFPRALL